MPAMQFLIRLIRDTRATSAVEYGLILGFIVIVMLTALRGMAAEVTSTWNTVATQTESATSQAVSGG